MFFLFLFIAFISIFLIFRRNFLRFAHLHIRRFLPSNFSRNRNLNPLIASFVDPVQVEEDMAKSSSQSSLTVEINKCRNAVAGLKSFQTSVNEAINDAIVKAESLIENCANQNMDQGQKFLLRYKLKKAYSLLKEYESFLDGGPWKYSDDLEDHFNFVSPPQTLHSEDLEDFLKFDSPPQMYKAPSAVTSVQSDIDHLLNGFAFDTVPVSAMPVVPVVNHDIEQLLTFETESEAAVAVVQSNIEAVGQPDIECLLNELTFETEPTTAVAVAATVDQPIEDSSDSESDESSSSTSSCRRVKRSNISEIGLDMIVECEISYIESPSSFWCRMRPCVDTKIEQELIDHLRQISHEDRVFKHPNIKNYCAAPYQTGYRRGRILEFKTNDHGRRFAKILFIDHGNKAWVAADRLLILPPFLHHYLWQATMCRLFGLEPAVGNSWSFDVVSKFRQFCEFNDLYLYAMDFVIPKHRSYTVKLIRKWEEGDEEPVEHEENAHEELFRNFNSSLKITDAVPSRRFKCSFEESSMISKDPPAHPEPWQIEFNYAVLRSIDEDNVDTYGGVCVEEDTMLGQLTNDQEVQSGDVATSRRPYNQTVNIVRGFNIPPGNYKLDKDGFLHLNLLIIVNPDEFYVSPRDPDQLQTDLNRETFRKFTEDMTNFYSVRENLYPIDFATVKDNPYAVAQLNSTSADNDDAGMFYRCRVKDYDREHPRNRSQYPATDVRQELRVTVFFVDLGRTEYMKPATEVYLLDQRFCDLPAQVLKCNLFSTRPVEEGVRTTFGNWRPETVEEFKKLCKFDRPMKATILMEETDRFGIVLFDVNASDRPIIVNQELMKKGLVRSDIIWVSFMAEPMRKLGESLIRQRRPIEESASSVDVDQLLRQEPCISRPMTCRSPRMEPRCIDPPEAGSIIEICVTCFFNCLKFPVTFPNGTMDSRKTKSDPALKSKSMEIVHLFANLCKEINDPRFVAQLPHFQHSPNVGDYCLSVFTEDKKLYRALIIESYPDDDQYRVKYVDYGNTEYVHLISLRPLNDELLRVPIMSLECHLSYVRPTEAANLQQNMNVLWEKIYRKPQKARVVEVIKRPSSNPLLMVDLRATDVDSSYLSVNSFVLEQGWAVGV